MNPLNCMNNSNELRLCSDQMMEVTTDTLPHRIQKTSIRVREFRYDVKWKADGLGTKWFVWNEYPAYVGAAPLLLGITESRDDAFDRVLFNSFLLSDHTIYLIQYWEDLSKRTLSKS